jgi:hypothetical protein
MTGLDQITLRAALARAMKAIIALLALFSPAANAAGTAPEIYFYPPPARLANGTLVASPLTVDVDQITVQFPQVEEMDGVVMMVPWSSLCTSAGQCHFEMIDKVLDYWKSRGKKVVLGISTAGPPVLTVQNGNPVYQGETPSWVSAGATTYQVKSDTIGHVGNTPQTDAMYPEYWDSRFAPLFIDLIRQLGTRYNGNPTLSYVRISTGLLGEDAPGPFGPHQDRAPGYSFKAWVAYTHRIVDTYAQAFPRSRLEFDISYLPWGYVAGDDADKKSTDELVADLDQKGVFVAFNGWQANALTWLQHAEVPGYSLNRLMHYLVERRHKNLPIGLEAVGPMTVPSMQNITSLAEVAHELQPQRLVFFGTDAGGIAYVRHGSSPTTATSEEWMKTHSLSLAQMGQLSIKLLQAVHDGH